MDVMSNSTLTVIFAMCGLSALLGGLIGIRLGRSEGMIVGIDTGMSAAFRITGMPFDSPLLDDYEYDDADEENDDIDDDCEEKH